MKFFLQNDTSIKIDQILGQLKKLMDGDVSYQMKQKGLEYKKNYGASIFWLRRMAEHYSGDNELADRLWYREIRETMILATMIAVPDDLLLSKIEGWSQIQNCNETAEQLGANLLYRIPNLTQWATVWLSSTSEWKRAAIWVGLATYLQKGGVIDENKATYYILLIKGNNDSPGTFMQRAQGRFLRQLCRKSSKYLHDIEDLVVFFRVNERNAWLVEDVQTEIDFLKDQL